MKRLTINRIASASLRTNKKSYIALVIGIFLSIFFVSCMVLGVHGLFMANEARRDARLGSQDAFWLDCEETDEVLMASGLYDGIGHVTIPAVHNDTSTSVGYYDDTAAAFLHRSFIEGRMPEKPGEIAIEESALARMRLDNVGVGDTVTLTLTPVEGVDEVRTFTIVGIMENQSANMKGYSSFSELYMEFPAILIHPTEAELSTGRLVQHKLFSFAPGVMGYQALTYYTRTDAQGVQTYGNLRVFDGNDNPTNWSSDLIAPNPAVLLYTVCIGVLAGTLLLATCVGIAGAMESQLSRRVSEIGMLRAVGATKKQIRRIFGREALLLALIVSPLAMLAGCGAAWTLEQAAPTLFLFSPSWWLLLPVLALSMLVILLSSWLPLRRASRMMPMSVMRDTEMLRRLRRVRPQKTFRPAKLVAWRQLTTGDVAQLRSLPGVKRVEMSASIRITQELGEDVPAYWEPVYYETTSGGYTIQHNLGNGHPYLLPVEEIPATVYEDAEDYTAIRQHLGIDGHLSNAIDLEIAVVDPAYLEQFVVSGDIDMTAINAGQEVLVVAPTIYAFLSPDGAVNSYRGTNDRWLQNRLSNPEYTLLASIENDAYTAGQPLTLHYVHSDSVQIPTNGSVSDYLSCYQQMAHTEVNVTVGAVLSGGFATGDYVVMVTTEQGLAAMGLPLPRVSHLNIYTHDLTLEEEAVLEKRITSIAMRGADYTVDNMMEMQRANARERLLEMLLISGASLILLTVCIAQITGSVSRRIRAEVRMIGTIRAVGADERVIFRIYGGQVAMSVAIGAVFGLVVYWGLIRNLPYLGMTQGFANWFTLGAQLLFAATTLLASLAILRLRVRDVTRHSIVENIREL